MTSKFEAGDALLIVDVQKDFCQGGALEISNGDEVVPVLNIWIERALEKGVPVYASRDWHPKEHVSFKEQGGSWPPHCLQDSEGALFHQDLLLPDSIIKVTKGVRLDHDQNSAFDETGLSVHLHSAGIKRLWVGGLAEDVCVLATALDGSKEGFEVILIGEATRPVTKQSGIKAREIMRLAGVKIHEKKE